MPLAFSEIYSIPLVILSVTTAVIASFTAFGIVERSSSTPERGQQIAWILFGAFSMGIGIWAMHFIGMLALKLPIPVFYDLKTTALSIIPAIFASAIILRGMTQKNHTRKQLLFSGILLGSGIGLMHHIGMMAMRMDAVMIHDATLSFLSILFAIVAATIALMVQVSTANQNLHHFINKRKAVSAFVMGTAISGMHYTAMAAVNFVPENSLEPIQGISANGLATMVSVAVLAIITASISLPLLLRYKQITKELTRLVAKEKKSIELLQLANKTAQQGTFEVNLQTGTMRTSDDYSVLLGYNPSEFVTSIEECFRDIHPEDVDFAKAEFTKAIETGEPIKAEYRRKTKDGRWLWIFTTGEIVKKDNRQKPLIIAGIHANITERKQREEVLRALAESGSSETENIFRKIVRQLALSHNMRYAMISLINSEEPDRADTLAVWAGGGFIDNISYPLPGSPCEKVAEEGLCFYPNNIQALFPKGHLLVDMEAIGYMGFPLKDRTGKTIGIINIIDDKPIEDIAQTGVLLESLSTRAVIELERLESAKKLELSARVFSDTHEGISITDENGTIIDVNPAFCEITGYSREEAIGQNHRFLKSGKQEPQFYTEMWQALKEHGHWQGELWNRKKDGSLLAELLSIFALKDDEGNILNYVGLFSDITHSKEQQKELELMAHYDVLTKLPNRALFYDRFKQAIAHSKRTNTLLAICFLDLDDFKPVNDSYGHDIGDQLLIEVASRIQTNIREEDTVSRQGGMSLHSCSASLMHSIAASRCLKEYSMRLLNPIILMARQSKSAPLSA